MLTPEEQKEYEQLSAIVDRPPWYDRILAGTANAVTTGIPDALMGGARGMLNMVADEPLPEVNIPAPFKIPEPTTYGEMGADLVPHGITSLATMIVPQVAVTNVLKTAGMSARAAHVIGMAAGGSTFGSTFSPESAGLQGASSAMMGAGDLLPRGARIPFALAAGGLSAADIYHATGNPAMAAAAGVADFGASFIGKKLANLPPQMRVQSQPPPMPGAPTPLYSFPPAMPGTEFHAPGIIRSAPEGAEGMAPPILRGAPEEADSFMAPPLIRSVPEIPEVFATLQTPPVLPQTPGQTVVNLRSSESPNHLADVIADPAKYPRYIANIAANRNKYPLVHARLVQEGIIKETTPVVAPVVPPSQKPPVTAAGAPQAPINLENVLPAIRVGRRRIEGFPGETHDDIFNRHLMDYPDDDLIEPTRIYMEGKREISEAEIAAEHGIKSSKDLPSRKVQPAPPPDVDLDESVDDIMAPRPDPDAVTIAPGATIKPIKEPPHVIAATRIKAAAEANGAKYDSYDMMTKSHQITLTDKGAEGTFRIFTNATDEQVAAAIAKKRAEFAARTRKSDPFNPTKEEDDFINATIEANRQRLEATQPAAPIIRSAPEEAAPTPEVVATLQPTQPPIPKPQTAAKPKAEPIAPVVKPTKVKGGYAKGDEQQVADRIAREFLPYAEIHQGEMKLLHGKDWRRMKLAGQELEEVESYRQALLEAIANDPKHPSASHAKLTGSKAARQRIANSLDEAVRKELVRNPQKYPKYLAELTAEAQAKKTPQQLADEALLLAPSRGKEFDIEEYTEGNNLRVVPEKGAAGGKVFETMRDVAPGAGKLKFEVPPGMSHAEANKLFNAKKKKLLATLQEGPVVTEAHVPFKDIKSEAIDDDVLKGELFTIVDPALGVRSEPTGLKKLKEYRGDEGSIMRELLRSLGGGTVGAIAGGPLGASMAEENRTLGFIIGAFGGGLLGVTGVHGLKFIQNAKTPHMGEGFAAVAEQAARGQGSSVAKAARVFEEYLGGNPRVNRALGMATGQAHMAALNWDASLRHLSKKLKPLPTHLQDAVHNYATADPLTAPASFARLQTLISDPTILGAAALERQTRINAQRLILEGLDPKDPMYATIRDSLGTYQKTVYKIHFDTKYKPTQADIDATIFELYSVSGPKMTYDTARVIVEQYLHETYMQRGLANMAAKYGTGRSAENLMDIHTRKNPSLRARPAFRRMMGEVTDPLEVRAATALKLIPAIRSGQFFSEMAKAKTPIGNKFALSVDAWNAELKTLRTRIAITKSGGLPLHGPHIPLATLQRQLRELQNYVPAPESHGLGLLSGQMVHRQVHDRLPGPEGILSGNSGPIVSSLLHFNNHVKQARVGANPLSWMRAIISIPFFMGISRAGLPHNWWNAAKEMRAKGAMWREAMEQGIMSGGYGIGEARRDLGITLDPSITESGISKVWNKIVTTGAGVMDWADSVTRVASYMHNKARFKNQFKGATEADLRAMATDHVNRYTMNYSTVSKGVRYARQMPFINQFLTYSSEMARITKNLVEDVITNRGGNRLWAISTLAAIPAVFETTEMIFENKLSDKDKAEWRKLKQLLPAYKRYGYLLPTGKRADGTWDYYNISPLFIADDIMRMVKSVAAGDMEAIMSNNPIIGWENTPAITAGAAAFGIDMRTKMELPTFNDRFDAIRKTVLPPLIGGYELDNFVNALTPNSEGTLGITNMRSGQRFEVSDLIRSYVTGARRTNVRMDILMEKEVMLAERRVKAIEADLRRVMYTNRTESSRKHAVQIAQRKVEAIMRELEQKLSVEDDIRIPK